MEARSKRFGPPSRANKPPEEWCTAPSARSLASSSSPPPAAAVRRARGRMNRSRSPHCEPRIRSVSPALVRQVTLPRAWNRTRLRRSGQATFVAGHGRCGHPSGRRKFGWSGCISSNASSRRIEKRQRPTTDGTATRRSGLAGSTPTGLQDPANSKSSNQPCRTLEHPGATPRRGEECTVAGAMRRPRLGTLSHEDQRQPYQRRRAPPVSVSMQWAVSASVRRVTARAGSSATVPAGSR